MMTNLILGLLLISAFPVFADLTDEGKIIQDRITVDCVGEYGPLKFKLNRSTQVAVFNNKRSMGRAELPLNEPIAARIDGRDVKITYAYYFTAEYTLTFAKPVLALKPGERIAMILDGDDNDGYIFNAHPFQCSIK